MTCMLGQGDLLITVFGTGLYNFVMSLCPVFSQRPSDREFSGSAHRTVIRTIILLLDSSKACLFGGHASQPRGTRAPEGGGGGEARRRGPEAGPGGGALQELGRGCQNLDGGPTVRPPLAGPQSGRNAPWKEGSRPADAGTCTFRDRSPHTPPLSQSLPLGRVAGQSTCTSSPSARATVSAGPPFRQKRRRGAKAAGQARLEAAARHWGGGACRCAAARCGAARRGAAGRESNSFFC